MGDTTKEKFLRKIWETRKRKQISQEEMAKSTGMSQRAYSSVENGTNRMYVDHLVKIAKVLKVTPGEFFVFGSNDVGPLNEEEKRLIFKLREVSINNDKLYTVIENLLDSFSQK